MVPTDGTEVSAERWCRTESEVLEKCNSQDEFYVFPVINVDGVIVKRNGTVTNRWADGTRGVPEGIAKLAANEESPYSCETDEEAVEWLNVYADHKTGAFIALRE